MEILSFLEAKPMTQHDYFMYLEQFVKQRLEASPCKQYENDLLGQLLRSRRLFVAIWSPLPFSGNVSPKSVLLLLAVDFE